MMKSHKLTLSCLLSFFIVVICCTSAIISHSIAFYGTVDTKCTENITIQITNIRTGESVIVPTIDGDYLFYWSKNDNDYYGDTFKITILNCIRDSKCKQYITYGNQSSIDSVFYIEHIDLCPKDITPCNRCNCCCLDTTDTSDHTSDTSDLPDWILYVFVLIIFSWAVLTIVIYLYRYII